MVARAGGQRGGPGEPGDRRLQPGAMASLRRAIGYLRGYWRDSAGALVALLLVSVTNLAAPQLIRLAIDTGVAGRQTNAIVAAVVGLVLVAVLRGLFSFAQGYLAERASQGVAYELRDALFAKLQRLSFSYYDGQQTGQLLTRLTSDVEQIRTFAGTGLVQIISADPAGPQPLHRADRPPVRAGADAAQPPQHDPPGGSVRRAGDPRLRARGL